MLHRMAAITTGQAPAESATVNTAHFPMKPAVSGPLTAGFIGKWAVFTVALSAGAWPVVIAAILCSIVAVFFYVRLIVLMFFVEGPVGGELATVTTPSLLTSGTILVGVAATLLLGVVPGPVLNLAGHAGQFIR